MDLDSAGYPLDDGGPDSVLWWKIHDIAYQYHNREAEIASAVVGELDRSNEWLAGPWFFGRLCLVLSWCDMWVGFCWDSKARMLYVAPLPGVIVGLRF